MTHEEAVAKCAGTDTIVSRVDILDALGHGFSGDMTGSRYYGLLADHSEILAIRTVMQLDAHEWAGFWKAAAFVPIRKA